MATITNTCTGCGRQLAVPDRYQGRDLKCPSCGHPFKVALSGTEPEPAPTHPVAAPPEPPPPVLPLGSSPFEDPPLPSHGPEEVGAPQTEFVEATAVFWRVKRIGVASLAALSGLIHAVFTPLAEEIPFLHGPLLAVLAIVLLPLVYGAAGFVLGAVTAVVYNLAAQLVGGVRLLLE